MGKVLAIWNGTPRDGARLLGIILKNCTCEGQPSPCPSHTLLYDQRFLDHLLFLTNKIKVLVGDEWLSKPPIRPPLW